MYAVIRTGGKQYRIREGDILDVEKLDGQVGDTLDLDEVLMVGDGEDVRIGSPFVEAAKVAARIVSHDRAPKIIVFKKKRRKGYRRKRGHRQQFTALKIEEISFNPAQAAEGVDNGS